MERPSAAYSSGEGCSLGYFLRLLRAVRDRCETQSANPSTGSLNLARVVCRNAADPTLSVRRGSVDLERRHSRRRAKYGFLEGRLGKGQIVGGDPLPVDY